MAHPPTPELPGAFLITFLAALAAIVLALAMSGCTGPLVAVDKSIHVVSFIDAGTMSRVDLTTRTTNTSDTTADGNTASAEADLSIPLLP